MAVTFISYGYDTTTGNPYTEIAWADAHPLIGSGQYGVRSGSDWKVTAVAGQDRTVSIAEGFGWGSGVIDKTVANDTIQLDTISSGSRWDLIVARRDWTPTAGETKFMKINGGSTKAIPGGRLMTPGGIDDQPIALVQVTAGQTQPTAIVDLRCWATNGGMVAKDDLVKGYLNKLGTEVYINGTEWRYIPGANDVPAWVTGGAAPYRQWFAVTTKTLTGTGGWWNVTLPAGYFTTTPMVFLTKHSAAGAGHVPYYIFEESSATTIKVGAFWGGNANTFDVTLGIHAVQANPSTAGGLVSG